MCGKGFPPKLKVTVFNSYAWPEIRYASKVWCFGENDMGIRERSMTKTMSGEQLKDWKKAEDFMLMSGLNKTIDQFAITHSEHWSEFVFSKENSQGIRF